MFAGAWEPNQPNKVLFVLVDEGGTEVTGLGDTFSLELSKNGAAFAASQGTKAEIGSGWYSYTATAGEADTPGPIALKVSHASIVQQNLEYVVQTRVASSVAFTYTVTNSANGNPISGATVEFATDSAGTNVVGRYSTDAFGVARDTSGNLPRLDPGTYYIWVSAPGFTFDNPDTEVVS